MLFFLYIFSFYLPIYILTHNRIETISNSSLSFSVHYLVIHFFFFRFIFLLFVQRIYSHCFTFEARTEWKEDEKKTSSSSSWNETDLFLDTGCEYNAKSIVCKYSKVSFAIPKNRRKKITKTRNKFEKPVHHPVTSLLFVCFYYSI